MNGPQSNSRRMGGQYWLQVLGPQSDLLMHLVAHCYKLLMVLQTIRISTSRHLSLPIHNSYFLEVRMGLFIYGMQTVDKRWMTQSVTTNSKINNWLFKFMSHPSFRRYVSLKEIITQVQFSVSSSVLNLWWWYQHAQAWWVLSFILGIIIHNNTCTTMYNHE